MKNVMKILAVTTLLSMAACGGSGSGGGDAVDAKAIISSDQDTIVRLPAQQNNLNIAVGTRVTWDNQDSSPHHFVSQDAGFDSGELDPGEGAYSFTFDTAGTYHYSDEDNSSFAGIITVN